MLIYLNEFKQITIAINPFAPWNLLCRSYTDLPSNSNISKTVRVNIFFTQALLKEYSKSVLIICRSTDLAPVVIKFLMINVCGIIGIWKIDFFNFQELKGLNKKKQKQKKTKKKVKIKNHSKPPKVVRQSLLKQKAEHFLVFH